MSEWSTADMSDMAGAVAVVTGASSGLGLAVTDALAAAGATVVMACRNPAKAERARSGLEAPSAATVAPLDLADRTSIPAFALWFSDRYDRLDLLVNNAGVMATPPTLTPDGVELQWATNHLGHFILTGLLLDHLCATDGSRVVTVSSVAALRGNLDGYDPTTLDGYRRRQAYANTKLANLVFSLELDRRLQTSGSTGTAAPAGATESTAAARTISVAAHPGLAHTNLVAGIGVPAVVGRALVALSRLPSQSVSAGALPILRAATDPTVEGGQWYGPADRGHTRGAPILLDLPHGTDDPSLGQHLWHQSANLTDIDYLP